MGQGAAMRRAVAFQQWLQAKGDADFAKSLEDIESTTEREAWRVFRQKNGRTVVRQFRVHPGEPLCHSPLGLCVDREQLAQGQDLGHALVTALATLDVDDTITSIRWSVALSRTKGNKAVDPGNRRILCRGIARNTHDAHNTRRSGPSCWCCLHRNDLRRRHRPVARRRTSPRRMTGVPHW